MSAAPAADQTNRPDPHQDRPATGADAPNRTGRLLGLVRALIDYGRQLVTTLQQRTSATNLADVTRNFGTIDIALILARITRGLHRAAALEAKLTNRLAARQPRCAGAPHPLANRARPGPRTAAGGRPTHVSPACPRPRTSRPRSAAARSAPLSPISVATSGSGRATHCGGNSLGPSSRTAATSPP